MNNVIDIKGYQFILSWLKDKEIIVFLNAILYLGLIWCTLKVYFKKNFQNINNQYFLNCLEKKDYHVFCFV